MTILAASEGSHRVSVTNGTIAPSLAPSGFRTIRTASHRARAGIAPPRTIRTVRYSRTTRTGAYKGTVRCECAGGCYKPACKQGSALTDQQPRAAHVVGPQAAALQRPPSWSGAAASHGASMLPSHRRAIKDILNCRTAALGGQVWRCDQCDTEMFSWHSCRNRSCPKCHTAQTQEWLECRRTEMLPVPYFHITITVPAELREVLRGNQRMLREVVPELQAENEKLLLLVERLLRHRFIRR